ncbi:MAG: aminotransferase class I/II-fold pyridoxal phosphate-dependent enzyme [Proteobacteria bacterium]|nr:aminotransferase class I/II-fold pyridoxal phosphate-dependent enzyme [Pseudomonadota bacterium]
MIDRRNLQAHYPFGRLNRLLEGVRPGAPRLGLAGTAQDAPVPLHLGEPRNQPPDFVAEELTRAAAGWSRYPLPRGTLDYREACVDWLALRYGLPTGMIDPETMVLAVPGTREGLFFAALANTPGDGGADGGAAVLIPNPCYHVYYSATAAAGAEPVFVSATAETGFQPDYTALDPALLDRTALAYFCTPSNPQGAIADLDQLQALIRLARAHDFTIAFDECYAEIYTGAPPPVALQAAAALGGSLDNLLVFHSLSKRSSAPGLRCGFAAGDPKRIETLAVLMSTGGAGVPLPVCAAGARLWREEDHAAANRLRYQDNFAIAERVLGNRFNFRKPGGGFFLWLEVGDGEAAALKLWREAGIKVLPGAYMCQGADGEPNPGAAFIRIALIYDADYTEAALRRVVEVL